MIYTPRKTPRWLFILQWACLSFLAASTIIGVVTQGGWREAINGLSLGILTMSLVMNPLINRIWRAANEAHDECTALSARATEMIGEIQQAIHDGRVELIQPDEITRH